MATNHPGEALGPGVSHAAHITTGRAPSQAWEGHLCQAKAEENRAGLVQTELLCVSAPF